MRPDEVERLLWEQADGTISAADRERLEAAIGADPAGESGRRRVAALAGLLSSVEPVEVPVGLVQRIDRAVAALPLPGTRVSPWRSWIGELLQPRWRVRIAWTAAGLAVGIAAAVLLVSSLRSGPGEDVTRYYGAMTHRSPLGDHGGLVLPLDRGSGRLTLRRDGSALLLDLDVTLSEAGPVVLEIEGGGLALEGVLAGGPSSVEVSHDAGRIALAVEPVSRNELRLTVAAETAVLTVRVSAGERTVLEREVRVAEVPPA